MTLRRGAFARDEGVLRQPSADLHRINLEIHNVPAPRAFRSYLVMVYLSSHAPPMQCQPTHDDMYGLW